MIIIKDWLKSLSYNIFTSPWDIILNIPILINAQCGTLYLRNNSQSYYVLIVELNGIF